MAQIAEAVLPETGNNRDLSEFILPAIVAGTGGMLPTLSRLAATYVDNPHTPGPAYGIYLGLGIFFIIGAILAFAFGEKSLRQALIIGISAPALINSIASGLKDADNAPRGQPPTSPAGEERLVDPETFAPIDSSWNFSLARTAYAQTTAAPTAEPARETLVTPGMVPSPSLIPNPSAVPGATLEAAPATGGNLVAPISRESLYGERRVTLRLSFTGVTKKNDVPIKVSFFDEGGYRVGQSMSLRPSAKRIVTRKAPVSAQGLFFQFDGIKKSVRLPQGGFQQARFDVTGALTKGNDLIWSLGYSRALVKVSGFDVKPGKVVPVKPIAEQVRASGNTRIFGIDASHFQKSIDWADLHQGNLRFAILRATYGRTPDRLIEAYWNDYSAFEKKDDIALGFYHFFRFGQAPEEQAESFLAAIGEKKTALAMPPAVGLARNTYDTAITDENQKDYFTQVAKFLSIVEEETGREAMLFINREIIEELDMPADLAAKPLWIKDFENSVPALPEGAERYRLWLLGTAKLPGVESVVDLNIYNGSAESFAAFTKAPQM